MVVYDNRTFIVDITKLNENTFYSFVIYANTSAGNGPNSTDSTETFEARKKDYSTYNSIHFSIKFVS